jgi:glutamate/tyrosine decarboxylase-like PLP-dependent enzyme
MRNRTQETIDAITADFHKLSYIPRPSSLFEHRVYHKGDLPP